MTLSVYEGRDLPPIIQRAITRVNDPAILQDMSPSLRWSLSVLLRRVSAEDGENLFWVKRSNFAKLLGVSEATVYRTLATFEELGLIHRISQKRSTEGAFTVGEMRLSDSFCKLVGLSDPNKKNSDSLYKRASKSRLSPVQDVLGINQGVKKFASQKHSPSESSGKSVGKSTIAPEFVQLLQQGLTRPQLFMLMGLARQANKRLGDIVVVCREPISRLRGKELFAYLRTLTNVNKDFAHILRESEASEKQKTEQTEQMQRMDQLKATYCGKWVSDSKTKLYKLEEIGRVAVYRVMQEGRFSFGGYLAGRDELQFWKEVESGQYSPTEAPPLHSYMH